MTDTRTETTATYKTTQMNTTKPETKVNVKKKQVPNSVTYTIDH